MKTLLFTLSVLFGVQLVAQEKSDTTELILGDKKIVIYDANKSELDSISDKEEKAKIFNAWSGLDLGFNMLRTSDGSITMPDELEYMELDYGKSLSWNLNFIDINWDWLKAEEKYGYNKRNIGIISGIGFSFENYTLKNNVTLINSDNGGIGSVDSIQGTFGFSDTTRNYSKNKLRATYVKIPLMLQFYSMKKDGKKVKHAFHLAAGVVGGLRVASSYKVKYKIQGDEKKDKIKDDYNMSPFSLDAEVRAGFGSVNLFATYGLTPLFEDNKGPELYPMTVGVSLLKVF